MMINIYQPQWAVSDHRVIISENDELVSSLVTARSLSSLRLHRAAAAADRIRQGHTNRKSVGRVYRVSGLERFQLFFCLVQSSPEMYAFFADSDRKIVAESGCRTSRRLTSFCFFRSWQFPVLTVWDSPPAPYPPLSPTKMYWRNS